MKPPTHHDSSCKASAAHRATDSTVFERGARGFLKGLRLFLPVAAAMLTAITWLAVFPVPAQASAPSQWVYAGVLYQYGEPFTGDLDMEVELFDAIDSETPLWSESIPDVPVDSGAFFIHLGTGDQPIDADLLTGETLWLQVTIDGETLPSRLPVASVPYAQRAEVASRSENAEGLYVGSTRVVDATGSWTGTPLGQQQLDLDVDLDELNAALDNLSNLTSRVETLEESLTIAEGIIEQQADTIDSLQLTVLDLQSRLQHVRREGTNLIVEGANLHIRSGGGSTYHHASISSFGTPNGLGNLIVGYNEPGNRDRDSDNNPLSGSTQGSHNVIIGPGHAYPGFASLVVGTENRLGPVSAGAYQAIPGCLAAGYHNSTGGNFSAAIAGTDNSTAAHAALAAGGDDNIAYGNNSTVIGGRNNTASASNSLVAGGVTNTASGDGSTVVGGNTNTASGSTSLVAGGTDNASDGQLSVIAGGDGNRTRSAQPGDTVVGAMDETVTGGSHYCAPAPACVADPD
ncbi:MAG: hypothetical protein JW797_06400 [Bradymonadales bacterium]|nr:hypothetical protein [Bradymonadales bacterium]